MIVLCHMPPKLTPELIAAAITGLQARKTRIDAHLTELKQMSAAPTRAGLSAKTADASTVPRKKRRFSAAAKARMAAAQRKRWAVPRKAGNLKGVSL